MKILYLALLLTIPNLSHSLEIVNEVCYISNNIIDVSAEASRWDIQFHNNIHVKGYDKITNSWIKKSLHLKVGDIKYQFIFEKEVRIEIYIIGTDKSGTIITGDCLG